MNEIWSDIKGFEGYYQLSNLDRVRSLDRVVTDRRGQQRRMRGRIMNPRLGSVAEYLLSKDGVTQWFSVQQLKNLA